MLKHLKVTLASHPPTSRATNTSSVPKSARKARGVRSPTRRKLGDPPGLERQRFVKASTRIFQGDLRTQHLQKLGSSIPILEGAGHILHRSKPPCNHSDMIYYMEASGNGSPPKTLCSGRFFLYPDQTPLKSGCFFMERHYGPLRNLRNLGGGSKGDDLSRPKLCHWD